MYLFYIIWNYKNDFFYAKQMLSSIFSLVDNKQNFSSKFLDIFLMWVFENEWKISCDWPNNDFFFLTDLLRVFQMKVLVRKTPNT